jgi:hypothetical protein
MICGLLLLLLLLLLGKLRSWELRWFISLLLHLRSSEPQVVGSTPTRFISYLEKTAALDRTHYRSL